MTSRRAPLLLLFLLTDLGCLRPAADEFFYGPRRLSNHDFIPATVTIGDQERPVEVFNVQTPDAEQIHVVRVRGEHPGRRVILYCHGRGGTMQTSWLRVEQLASADYDVAIYDYRGFGMSTGHPSEAGLRMDTRAVLAHLRATSEPDAPFIYYGHSLGGAVCIDLAESDPPVALVAESTFTSAEAIALDGLNADLPASFFVESRWDSLSKIARIRTPLLLLHGLEDKLVDPRYSRELALAHVGPTQLELVPIASHENLRYVLGERYLPMLQTFLDGAMRH